MFKLGRKPLTTPHTLPFKLNCNERLEFNRGKSELTKKPFNILTPLPGSAVNVKITMRAGRILKTKKKAEYTGGKEGGDC